MSGGPQTTGAARNGGPATVLAARLAANGRILVMRGGDSTTGGDNAGDVSVTCQAYGRQLQILARAERDDISWIGTRWNQTVNPFAAIDGAHQGVPGYKIEEWQSGRVSVDTGYPGYISSLGVSPDVLILQLGTNNFATDTGAVCLAKFSSLLSTVFATSPSIVAILVWSTPPSPTASPNNVNRNAFVAGLPALCASFGSRVVYVDTGSLEDSLADKLVGDSPAWTHSNEHGLWKQARSIYNALKSRILPPPSGPVWPRPYQGSNAQAALVLGTSSTDSVYWSSNAAMEIGPSSFFVAFQVYFTALPTGSPGKSLYSYGYATNPTHLLAIFQNGTTCTIYFNGTGSPLVNFPAVPNSWKLNTWHSVIFTGDVTNLHLSLYIDGTLRGRQTVTAWNLPTGDYHWLGSNQLASNAPSCLLRNFTVGVGALVPQSESGANGNPFRPWAEAYDREQVFPPGVTAHYTLGDGSGSAVASDIGGATSTGHTGTVAWSAAGVVPTPWDSITTPGSYPLTGTITGTTTITDASILASDLWIFTRTVDGGTLTSPPKAVSSAGSATFTYEALDTSTYVYKRVPAAP